MSRDTPDRNQNDVYAYCRDLRVIRIVRIRKSKELMGRFNEIGFAELEEKDIKISYIDN